MARSRSTVITSLRRVVPPQARLLVGVSGGVDSVVLLCALLSLQRSLRLTIEVAHVDHALRSESARDAEFVQQICAQRSIPFHLYRVRKPATTNIEEWGRKVRYRFFRQLRRARRLEWIVTAHTANDLAETLLMRLIANKELSLLAERADESSLLRPLLSVPRAEIERFAAREGIAFREDESNRDLTFLRNRIRHLVLPLLTEHFDRNIVETLALRGRSIHGDVLTLRAMADAHCRLLSPLECGSREWIAALRRALEVTPEAVQWRVVERALAPQLGFALGERHSRRVIDFLGRQGRTLELPGGWSLRRSRGAMMLEVGTK